MHYLYCRLEGDVEQEVRYLAIRIHTPVSASECRKLRIRDELEITGLIYTGRDAALPLLVRKIQEEGIPSSGLDLEGAVIFHTAVSVAGIGPTTSNKLEIEESIPFLSSVGVKIHIGKGAISARTVEELKKAGSVYAVTPPISALLGQKVVSCEVAAFPEQGMEAIHRLHVMHFPAIVAAAQGKAINKYE